MYFDPTNWIYAVCFKVLFRDTAGNGETVAMAYGSGKEFPNCKAAAKAAETWVAKELKRQGI